MTWPVARAIAGVFAPSVQAAADPASPEARSAAAAQAQAQALQRQQAREKALRPQQELQPDVRLDVDDASSGPMVLPGNGTPCFPIQRIELQGEAADRFQSALARAHEPHDEAPVTAQGRCLGPVGLNLLMKRIHNAVIAKGWMSTRVVAGPQELRESALRLTPIPGRIREVRLGGEPARRGTRWNAMALRRGQWLNLRDIEQALENFSTCGVQRATKWLRLVSQFPLNPLRPWVDRFHFENRVLTRNRT